MADVLSFNPSRALTANIGAAAAARAFFYSAGTTNLKTVYADGQLTTPHPSPLLADAAGIFPQVFTDGAACKVVVQNAGGATLYTLDPAPSDRVSGFSPIGLNFADVATLLADASMTYAAGNGQVTAGDIVRTNAEGFAYQVAASGASDHHVTTAGGVKLYVLATGGRASVRAFGAVGNGVVDDTAPFQAALTSSIKVISGEVGDIYLIDGGLTSSVTDRTIDFTGCTIKLKDNAASLSMLSCSGARTTVVGGYWDGNRANGNSEPVPGVAIFASFAVLFTGHNSTARGLFITGCAGMGIKFANCNDTLIEGCTIRDSILYGIYGEAVAANVARPKAIGNTIDTSQGGNYGQGILFTSGGGFTLTDYEVSGNTVVGPQGASLSDQAINIAVRGDNGIIANNVTQYGSMGFSEGGDNCTVVGNVFRDMQGSAAGWGVELSGANCTVSGNTISQANIGVVCSNVETYDGCVISGNSISLKSSGTGVLLQIDATKTGRNISISNNVFSGAAATYGIRTIKDVQGISISGNTFVGPGTGSGRAIYFDTPPTNLYASIVGNTFTGWQRAYAIYSVSALTVNHIYISSNMTSNSVSAPSAVNQEGSAVVGTNVRLLSSSGNVTLDVIDQANNVFLMYSANFNNPEGGLTAGIGSIHVSLNASGGIYRKNTGTGNTGWVAM